MPKKHFPSILANQNMDKNLYHSGLDALYSTVHLLNSQLAASHPLHHLLLPHMTRILPHTLHRIFVAEPRERRSQLLEDAQGHSEDGYLLVVEQLVPEFEGGFEGEPPAEEGEEPFDEVDL